MATNYTKNSPLSTWAETGAVSPPPSMATGWPQSSTPPSRQIFNWILNWLSNGIRYHMQMGVPEYDATDNYRVGSVVQSVVDGMPYRCILANGPATSVVEPTTNTTYWQRLGTLRSQLITASGSWTVPAGVSRVRVTCLGGGGGGGHGGIGTLPGAGGGGAIQTTTVISCAPGQTATITIGAGGTSDTAGGSTIVLLNGTSAESLGASPGGYGEASALPKVGGSSGVTVPSSTQAVPPSVPAQGQGAASFNYTPWTPTSGSGALQLADSTIIAKTGSNGPNASIAAPGRGGPSSWPGSLGGAAGSNSAGAPGSGYGSGGGGGATHVSTQYAGGTGANGVVLLEWVV